MPTATLAIHVQPVASAQSIGIRVLLITGGHSYDREALPRVFRDNAGISFTHGPASLTRFAQFRR